MSWSEAAADVEAHEKWFMGPQGWDLYLTNWDVWIPDANMNDWETFYRFAVDAYPCNFDLGLNKATTLPETADEVFARTEGGAGMAALRIDVGGVRFDCLFLERDEIELGYYASVPTFEQRFNSMVAFMEAIGRLLRKRVELKADLEDRPERAGDWTWERRHENPDAVHSPEDDSVVWLGSGISPL